MMPTSLNSPKMTRSLQQISDKFGGSLPSVNKLPMPKNLHLQDKLHTVQVKVSWLDYILTLCEHLLDVGMLCMMGLY